MDCNFAEYKGMKEHHFKFSTEGKIMGLDMLLPEEREDNALCA